MSKYGKSTIGNLSTPGYTAQNTKYGSMGKTGGLSKMNEPVMPALDEEEQAKMAARKIGPFSFDIDDDIDAEVLTNEQVYDDLKEIEDILD